MIVLQRHVRRRWALLLTGNMRESMTAGAISVMSTAIKTKANVGAIRANANVQ